MKLLTKDILGRLPKIGETSEQSAEETKVPLKLFGGQSTWFITEFDGEDMMYGFCDLGDPQFAELGYVSFKELLSIRFQFGLSVERDKYWDSNTTLAEVMSKYGR
jgi:hypothetical protein